MISWSCVIHHKLVLRLDSNWYHVDYRLDLQSNLQIIIYMKYIHSSMGRFPHCQESLVFEVVDNMIQLLTCLHACFIKGFHSVQSCWIFPLSETVLQLYLFFCNNLLLILYILVKIHVTCLPFHGAQTNTRTCIIVFWVQRKTIGL